MKVTREDLGFRSPVYDGNKNIYTSLILLQEEYEIKVTVNLGGADFDFFCQIQFVGPVNIGLLEEYYNYGQEVPQEVIQALEIILRHGSTTNRIPIRNSLYPKSTRDDQLTTIGPNKFVSFGHYQAITKTKVGPTLLIDRSATAFFRGGPLIQFIENYGFNLNNLADEIGRGGPHNENLRKELKGNITLLSKFTCFHLQIIFYQIRCSHIHDTPALPKALYYLRDHSAIGFRCGI